LSGAQVLCVHYMAGKERHKQMLDRPKLWPPLFVVTLLMIDLLFLRRTFDASSGQSDSTRFVIDTFEVKEVDGHVFVSVLPRNAHVQGQRRDFGGKELN